MLDRITYYIEIDFIVDLPSLLSVHHFRRQNLSHRQLGTAMMVLRTQLGYSEIASRAFNQ